MGLSNSFLVFKATANILIEIQKASIFAMTSKTECFPMVLLEALACSTPIVSYDCPNGPRNIIDNNINGFLINDKNRQMFAKQLKLLIDNENLRNQLSIHAKESSKKFDKRVIMQQWESLFENLVSQ